MLSPSELSVGCLADASDLSILLPRDADENTFLITSAPGSRVAIFLDGEHRFRCFVCGSDSPWNGVIIPGVAIELDEHSLFNPKGQGLVGCMIRKEGQLSLVARGEGFRGPSPLPIITDLPLCRDNLRAGFTRWQIALGQGLQKRVLMSIDVTPK